MSAALWESGSGDAREEINAGAKHSDVDQDPDLAKLGNYWGTIAERYIGGRMRLHIHMHAGVHGQFYDVCAAFEALAPVEDHSVGGDHVGFFRNESYWQKMAVLVDVPETVEPSKEREVASLVRLARLDDCYRLIAHAKQRAVARSAASVGPLLAHPDSESVRWLFSPDREGMAAIGLPAIEDNELPHEVVERGAEVMNDLPNDRAPAHHVAASPSWAQLKAITATVTVNVGVNGVRVSLGSKAPDVVVQAPKLLYSALPLRPDSVEVGLR